MALGDFWRLVFKKKGPFPWDQGDFGPFTADVLTGGFRWVGLQGAATAIGTPWLSSNVVFSSVRTVSHTAGQAGQSATQSAFPKRNPLWGVCGPSGAVAALPTPPTSSSAPAPLAGTLRFEPRSRFVGLSPRFFSPVKRHLFLVCSLFFSISFCFLFFFNRHSTRLLLEVKCGF